MGRASPDPWAPGAQSNDPRLAASPAAVFRVGVENVIFSVDTARHRLLVLLVRCQGESFLGQWRLPGTLVRLNESLEAAAYRTLAEKIQVQNLYLEQLYTFSQPEADARAAGSDCRYLSVSYFALVRFADARLIHHGSSPIAWHCLAQLPTLAFDHDQILAYGHHRLRNKLEYSPVAFEVLPAAFTLGEVYQLYQTVLGEDFSDYSNFRARLLKLGILQETGEKISRGTGRPASLYRFDPTAFAPLKDKPLVFV